MYYVNEEQIELRMAMIPVIADACASIRKDSRGAAELSLLAKLAQERVLHLAIELVTDVGSLLIDGFLLRDASSYEDIIEILRVEGVFAEQDAELLLELVRLRRPLVQEYMTWSARELHPLVDRLPQLLPAFESSVRRFMERELGRTS
ncbi:DUF86 domain-containing protein [Paenibacillus koleovorans]|uniref:DUF86 domain-containing protein n=1 Tax=Paenibacillus koleovorans TaxID=121608 RepID=UPI000FD9FFFE|nr:HepT-like ribonuclease domain-containing protein [Paenibacillus koleovorans]